MADSSNKQQHIYHLSALDQSVNRTYITIALCFPCDDELVDITTTRFLISIKKTISFLPILAGTVRKASDFDGASRGFVEVAVSLDDINNFEPNVKYLNGADAGTWSYEALRFKRFPASRLKMAQLAPLAQNAAVGGGPAFAAQLNIISGGVIVTFQLHHSVADLVGLQTIVRYCSWDGNARALSNDALKHLAMESAKQRDRLSDSGGLTPLPSAPQTNVWTAETAQIETATCVLGFRLKIIDDLVSMANDKYTDPSNQLPRALPVSAFEVLAAILWRSIIRARRAAGLISLNASNDIRAPLSTSKLIVPVNVRERLEPKLSRGYFGNAHLQGTNTQSLVSLDMPLQMAAIAPTAQLVRAAQAGVSERAVRLAIAGAKNSTYHNNTNTTTTKDQTDVVVTDWSSLLPAEANLALRLGETAFVRKLAGADADEACIIHGRPDATTSDMTTAEGGEAIWEATLTLQPATLSALLRDDGAMAFVSYVDGEPYVGGRTGEEDERHQRSLEEERQKWVQRTAWRQGMTGSAAGQAIGPRRDGVGRG